MFIDKTVADFLHEGQWNWRKLLEQEPSCQLTSILATDIPQLIKLPNKAVWKLNNNGPFNCSYISEGTNNKAEIEASSFGLTLEIP